jgi:membrane protease YdiL (CAAX protease family)
MDLWALVFFLVVVQPILGHYRFRRLAGGADFLPTRRKLTVYATIVITQWLQVILCVWVLARRGLRLPDIGLAGAPPASVVALAAVVAASIVFATVRNVRTFAREGKESVPSHIRKVTRILPSTSLERAGFVPVAFTAGFCEEVLYRGFLFFAFRQVIPSTGLALGATAVVFGIAHSYQGLRGVITTGILGWALAGIYWYGRSLWPGIGLHVVVDLASGMLLGVLAAKRSQAAAIDSGLPAPPEPVPDPAQDLPPPVREESTGAGL